MIGAWINRDRHLEKTGGSSVRSYFSYWDESFRCAGQFCKLNSAKPELSSLEEKFVELIDGAISQAREAVKVRGGMVGMTTTIMTLTLAMCARLAAARSSALHRAAQQV